MKGYQDIIVITESLLGGGEQEDWQCWSEGRLWHHQTVKLTLLLISRGFVGNAFCPSYCYFLLICKDPSMLITSECNTLHHSGAVSATQCTMHRLAVLTLYF